MDRYALLNSKFINDDSELMRTYIQAPNMTIGSNMVTSTNEGIFGKRHIFDIPKEYTGLVSMAIRTTMTSSGNNSGIASYLGTRIFKYIELRTKSGTILGKLYPEYLYSRVDQLTKTTLGENIELSVGPDATFNNATVNLWTPLFFWFSESEKLKLPTRYLEDLELFVEVQPDYVSMGLDATLTALSHELHMNFLEARNEPEPSFPKTIFGYDVFREKQQTVSSGTTETTVEMLCPYPCFTTVLKLNTPDNQSEVDVNKIEYTTLGRPWLTKYRRFNYDLANSGPIKNVSLSSGSPMVYKYTKEIKRAECDKMKNFIQFNGSMRPTNIKVTHVDPGATATMTVLHEHLQQFDIDSMGNITAPLMGRFDSAK